MPPARSAEQARAAVALAVASLKARQEQADLPAHPAHLARYYREPYTFVTDCFQWRDGQGPTSYQRDILSVLAERKRMAVRGPHGLGKTAVNAWTVLWFALTRDDAGIDWKIPTTASAWRQLTKYLWPEIHKWARRLRWDALGREPFDQRTELLSLRLKLRYGEAFAVASDTPELIEGAHADALLYVFDEAKVIPPGTFDAAEGAFSNAGGDTANEALALATSTPGEPNGRFYDIHSRKPGYEDWQTRRVTLEETIDAGRVSAEWAEQRARQWGRESAVYQNRVLGEFATSDEDGVIPLAWVEQANDRWRAWDDAGRPGSLTAVGVDVATSGQDRTVFALRHGPVIAELRRFSEPDTMATAGRVEGLVRGQGGYAVVDVIGNGAGVYDRLKELQAPARPFVASGKSDLLDLSGELGFTNQRSAGWWRLRELLDPQRGEEISLPPDDLLTGDLTAPHWRVMSGGRIQVESKDDIAKRLGRSTDDGDAVMMAFAEAGGGFDVAHAYHLAQCPSCGRSVVTPPWATDARCPTCGAPLEDDPAHEAPVLYANRERRAAEADEENPWLSVYRKPSGPSSVRSRPSPAS